MNLYFDNATTSHPKPEAVLDAVSRSIARGGSYSRGAYGRIAQSTLVVEKCRDAVGELIGASGDNIIFTLNATNAINLILQRGRFGDTVYVSPMEHNAVMRPLSYLSKTRGVKIVILPAFKDGRVDIDALNNFETKSKGLVVINHQSNVNGVVQDVDWIAAWANSRGLKVLVDAVQSLGNQDFSIENIDYLAFTGHKNLLGITGVGGAFIKDSDSVESLIFGGTGSNSDSFEMPNVMPDMYEAGTPNIVGIECLLAALENRPEPKHSKNVFFDFIREIEAVDNVHVYKSNDSLWQGEVFSFMHDEFSVSDVATKLYDQSQIEVRSGFHCAPLAHKTLDTFASGTVRVALSPYHCVSDLDYFVKALWEIK